MPTTSQYTQPSKRTAKKKAGLQPTQPLDVFQSPIDWMTGWPNPNYRSPYNPLENASVESTGNTLSGLTGYVDAYNTVAGPSANTGGGTGTTSTLPTDPWGGFAGENFKPGGQGILEDQPRIIIREALKRMGYNADDGMLDLLQKDAGKLESLAMLGMGAGSDPNSQNYEDYLNFANEWVKGQLAPGGAPPDGMELIQRILDAPEGSALKAALDSGDPQQQAGNFLQLMEAATMGQTPMMRQALGSLLQDKVYDWLADKANGDTSMLPDFLQRNGKGILR